MPRLPAALPPYLTSGASSRAHHGLLVRLNEAASTQEEDEIIHVEISRAKEVLSVRGQSKSKIAETLIILLHCLMLRHRTEEDVEFALVSALQLAEGGRTIAERRIGYLYLVERLPKGHELNLLVINTIRKDLSSSTPSHILLALQTIAKIPSEDLAPAVIPLLTTKSLLRHKIPAIRQRGYEALLALHRIRRTTDPFPLTINKLLKSLDHEQDLSVLAMIFRSIGHILDTGAHHFGSEEERLYVLERGIEIARDHELGYEGQIALEVVKTLGQIVESSEAVSERIADALSRYIAETLDAMKSCHRWEGAFLLEVCQYAKHIPQIYQSILRHISNLLLPDQAKPSSSTSSVLPAPNDHVLVLRCLKQLRLDVWDGVLGEREMGVIMEGVNSVDDSIRKLTIRLLRKLSPDLPLMVLQAHLDSIKSSTNLSLPLAMANGLNIDEMTRLGRYETALRALEVVEASSAEDGHAYGEGVLKILRVLEEENGGRGLIWNEGAGHVLGRLEHLPRASAEATTISLLELLQAGNNRPGDTTVVIITSITCQYLPSAYDKVQEIIEYFVNKITHYNASIQELILVTLVSLLTRVRSDRLENSTKLVHETIQDLREGSSRYLKKISTVINRDLLDEVKEKSKSSKLADILDAIISVSTTHSEKLTPSDKTTLSPPEPRANLSASRLRYDAYQSPSRTRKSNERYRDHFEDDSD
ncbi:hypothetical protein L486_03869 [Kwoniella mangroviensis CBS 10435]|uniref:Clathrin/coatomer adaptor adaptin-like N-terminal domain-containing protein n=1 Tax=Kwoniella mangroviensis CBS 10435 TaxID=1331196 RepID=A0A1B9IV23_9TREE|nr:hypothetical protein L486_03869 [Kwoniella mangroviensis CBS 10435]